MANYRFLLNSLAEFLISNLHAIEHFQSLSPFFFRMLANKSLLASKLNFKSQERSDFRNVQVQNFENLFVKRIQLQNCHMHRDPNRIGGYPNTIYLRLPIILSVCVLQLLLIVSKLILRRAQNTVQNKNADS